MASLPILNNILSTKNYCQIVIDIFQEYANEKFESKFLWRAMKINFKDSTKEYWD